MALKNTKLKEKKLRNKIRVGWAKIQLPSWTKFRIFSVFFIKLQKFKSLYGGSKETICGQSNIKNFLASIEFHFTSLNSLKAFFLKFKFLINHPISHKCLNSAALSYLTIKTCKYQTLLPSIFMTGVHPPSPHPKSPMWQRTEIGFESTWSVTRRLPLHLLNRKISIPEGVMSS